MPKSQKEKSISVTQVNKDLVPAPLSIKKVGTRRIFLFGVFGYSLSLVVVVGLIYIIVTDQLALFSQTTVYEAPIPSSESVSKQLGFSLSASDPIRLQIPTIELDTTFEGSLGLNLDNSVEVPESYEQVGWYGYGPTPGELGPAVILGHVDSVDGPAVFYKLGQLEVGDEIVVGRADNSEAIFAVTALDRVQQDTFPTSAVYADINHAGLRLITCSGRFDRGEQRYSHNLIVYAELKTSE